MTAAADPNRNALAARAIAEELARAGVREVAIAPGSRSGPLALALAAAPDLRASVHLDERSAAFFALGAAKASGRPAAVLTTSGTAVANLLPAAVEAFHARVPLVLLTADRPPELQACGAPQTIDQTKIFGAFVRASAALGPPEPTGSALRALRATVSRLVEAASWPTPGPVHLNLPFREPLDPRPVAGDVPPDLEARDPLAVRGRPDGAPFHRPLRDVPSGGGPAVEHLAALLAERPRALIVAGPDAGDDAAAILALARAAGAPVLADPLSALRRAADVPDGAVLCASYDAFLRSDRLADSLAPDVVIRFGAPPVSKPLTRFLERHSARTRSVLVSAAPGIEDPQHAGADVLRADPAALARAVAAKLPATPPSDFAAALARAEACARTTIDAAAAGPWFEAGLVRAIDRALPEGAILFAGNSMPIRELDAFLPARPRGPRVLANRGASGIDGVVSSALGAVRASGRPGALLVGDLSLLHDAGGLLAARREQVPLAIVAIHNDGGAIFSYLPAREAAPETEFERLFTTPHGLDFRPLADLFQLRYTRIDEGASAAAATAQALTETLAAEAPALIEVRLERNRSVALHRNVFDAVIRTVEADL